MAKGIMLVILSNKPTWKIYPEEIAKRTGLSRSTVDKYFKRLEKVGYMRTVRRSKGYKKGLETFRFAADFKLADWYFNDYILPKLEASLTN
ncbi:TPA: HTH domain-containing protein [Streptococcus pyogenes]|jgi:DNA-binding IclR family transcriptional regulator|uniref:helix-turn-helix domain-containing protein n=1 Tax=uncultured Streptococcus sp. TaxID=83427 RepID=UPI00280B5130|nr:helix-turn-helix domain-containing protein [uncultured Streptococcus sp.]HES9049762.1 HTH domain-containing protein [Streptococcus pyogenes]